MSQSEVSEVNKPLTDAEKARIERNRQKALHLRQAKLVIHPYANENTESVIKVQGTRYIDSGGGFLIEESVIKSDKPAEQIPVIIEKGISQPITYLDCLECDSKFVDSYLLKNFDYSVCDTCRDPDGKHSLITKTDAKQEYLLKDCDLDKREPNLKYIIRKNPHNVHWGEMKLYLQHQIVKRAHEVWGSDEEIQKQRQKRDEMREVYKIKKYNKDLKKLRMEMRSKLYDKTAVESHTHEFGPESYDEENDTYSHSCRTCQYTETYEKM